MRGRLGLGRLGRSTRGPGHHGLGRRSLRGGRLGGLGGCDAAKHVLGLGGAETLVRVLAQQAVDDRPQRARVGRRAGFVGDDGSERRQRVVPLERRVALDRSVQGGAEPPQVSRGT